MGRMTVDHQSECPTNLAPRPRGAQSFGVRLTVSLECRWGAVHQHYFSLMKLDRVIRLHTIEVDCRPQRGGTWGDDLNHDAAKLGVSLCAR